jgi:hypothetical protein
METNKILSEINKMERDREAALKSAKELAERIVEAKSKLKTKFLSAEARIYRGAFGAKCLEISERDVCIQFVCKEAIDLADFIDKHFKESDKDRK